MFWSGNFMAVRELNFLLKDENVTLESVLEADDILQECKADNKALIQFLTRPDILAELITLITEEPPKHMALSEQYRHPSIACEVLTSHLSTLSDRLTLDTVQMNRLCDFINRDPPLNPLLASYFSKTIEMLLERSPKQDWYLYHIVCLRVLDLFKSRRDFLPNLLRHLATSAIADTFKYLIRLDDLFNKPLMEWLEEHQFIDSLIQIICGSYTPEPPQQEKGQRETSEKELHTQHNGGAAGRGARRRMRRTASARTRSDNDPTLARETSACAEERAERAERAEGVEDGGEAAGRGERLARVAACNAGALLCELVATGCAAEGCGTRSKTAWQLGGALGGAACVRQVLGGAFTSAPRHRAMALHHAATLLRTLLVHHTSESEEERCGVELAVAPHLPLLHQALLHHPDHYLQEEGGVGVGVDNAGDTAANKPRVGAARLATAALVAQLALSEVEEVATTLLTLGTPGVLIELMFQFPENNFLHAQVVAFCRNALANALYRTQYARHLFLECDLLTRLMDVFEDNENKFGSPRAGYMGHVIQVLAGSGAALGALADGGEGALAALAARWAAFRPARLDPVLLQHNTPLGGSYPSDNTYELDNISDTLAANYDFSDMAAPGNMDELGDDLATDREMRVAEEHADSAHFIADGLGLDEHEHDHARAQNSFLELVSQRFADDMWECADEAGSEGEGEAEGEGEGEGCEFASSSRVLDVLGDVSPWESGGSGSGSGGEVSAGAEGWAQFDAFAPPQAFAPGADADQPRSSGEGLEESMRALRLDPQALDSASTSSLASNLLTAMSAMTPDAIANIVNANLQPLPPLAPLIPPHFTRRDGPAELTSSDEASLPNEVTLPAAPVLSDEAALPSEATLPNEVILPAEATLHNELTLPDETALPDEVTLPGDKSLLAQVTSSNEVTSVEINLPAEKTSSETLPCEVTLPSVITLPATTVPNTSEVTAPVLVNSTADSPAQLSAGTDTQLTESRVNDTSESNVHLNTSKSAVNISPADVESKVTANEVDASCDVQVESRR